MTDYLDFRVISVSLILQLGEKMIKEITMEDVKCKKNRMDMIGTSEDWVPL
jgi:hypothetical protein